MTTFQAMGSNPLRSEWTVAERAEAANQIARNYMAVAMLQNELDLPNDGSIAYFMYGGAGPMASFENPDTGVEYDFAQQHQPQTQGQSSNFRTGAGRAGGGPGGPLKGSSELMLLSVSIA